jgi:hypothetical protein
MPIDLFKLLLSSLSLCMYDLVPACYMPVTIMSVSTPLVTNTMPLSTEYLRTQLHHINHNQ